MRDALRGCAVLALLLGIAAAAPVQRLERVSESRAGVGHPGERGDAPAICGDRGVERPIAHDLPAALPPVPAVARRPALAVASVRQRRAGRTGRGSERSNGARAPPPSA